MHMRGIIATSDFKIEIAYIRSLDPSDIFQFSVATTEMSSTETGASLCTCSCFLLLDWWLDVAPWTKNTQK